MQVFAAIRSTLFIAAMVSCMGAFKGHAQQTDLCRPFHDQTYSSSVLGGYREVIPPIAYNDYLIDQWSLTRFVPLDQSGVDSVPCSDAGAIVVNDAYAISPRPNGPWFIGSPCAAEPRVGIFAHGQGGPFTSLSFYSESILSERSMDRAMQVLLAETVRTWVEDGSMAGMDFERDNGVDQFARISFLILNVIDAQCGGWPSSLEFVVYMGPDAATMHISPEVMTISARSTPGDGYVFDFQNLGTAKLFTDEGREASQADFERSVAWLRQRETERQQRFAQWQSPEGQFALGALIVAGALTGIALNSPCFDDPDHFTC